MDVVRLLMHAAGRMSIVLVGLGLANGAFSAGLIATVHRAISEPAGAPGDLLALFVVFGAGKVLSSYASGVMTQSYALETIAGLQRQLIGKLLEVPYRRIEQAGRSRIIATLTQDVQAVNGAFGLLPGVTVSAAMVAGGSMYLLYLSPQAFVLLLLLGALSALSYLAVNRTAQRHLRQNREHHTQMQRHLRALVEGTKELKMHVGRRRAFLNEEVLETTEALMETGVVAHSRYMFLNAVSTSLVLVVIGYFLFALPGLQDAPGHVVSGYVIAFLYLMGPLNNLTRSIPVFLTASICLARVQNLGVTLSSSSRETQIRTPEAATFERIELVGATHSYSNRDGDRDFTLGPISLSLRPGELVFITGGNGSGKSTLAKLLLGLYAPESGEVRWDGAAVQDAGRDRYRQLFSAVFSDYFLFDRLLGLDPERLDERARQHLQALGLESVVRVQDGILSTTRVSHGQRKRLALLTAYLEDRPVYVFDEWAADQDPSFKDTFYRELITELRSRGKTVLVITHDDRYFGLADRVLHMRDGRLASPD